MQGHLIIKKADLKNGLKGISREIDRDFVLKECKNLKSTKYFPKKVGGSIYIDHGVFEKFEDLPKKTNDLIITYCLLKSLEGLPEMVYGNLLMDENELSSDFESNEKFFPKKILGILKVPKHWFKKLNKDEERIKDYLITICEVNRNDILVTAGDF